MYNEELLSMKISTLEYRHPSSTPQATLSHCLDALKLDKTRRTRHRHSCELTSDEEIHTYDLTILNPYSIPMGMPHFWANVSG